MFDEIAGSYDLTNRVLSLGVDIAWRLKACRLSLEYLKRERVTILDVACGTGDMILHWERVAKEQGVTLEKISGVDPSGGMLKVAKEKLPHISFIQAEAKAIPLEDSSIDVISIAYGIRNVVEREAALNEFCRLLKPGGILVILEFTKNENLALFDYLSKFYLKYILPLIGGLVSKSYESYRYLPDSIEAFLTKEGLARELVKHGLEMRYMKSYSAKISTLFIAKKGEAHA